ncbi:MAG: hypothetical protein V1756_01790 [Patescibacteria group bacterium]
MKFKKDNRDKLWARLEMQIQGRAGKKDKKFILKGKWKKFLRKERKLKIFAVDGEWIRNNLSVIFGHGGHGYVHEFIPLDEIWIATHHFSGCGCKNVRRDKKASKEYFDSTTLHEITEFYEMKKKKTYWKAHQISLETEKKAGFLENPFIEHGQKD